MNPSDADHIPPSGISGTTEKGAETPLFQNHRKNAQKLPYVPKAHVIDMRNISSFLSISG